MPETTTDAIKAYLGSGIAGVSDGTIDLHKDDAKQRVIDDGVAVIDPEFEKMHRFMASHTLATDGHYQEVTSESVKDTSRSVVANARSEGGSSLLAKYEERLTKKFGLGDRIGVDV